MHSEAELAQKLRRRGHDAEEIAAVIAGCARQGYLNDAAFATALVERRTASRGAAAIAAELRAKGLGRQAVETALAPVDRATEIDAAMELFARYGASRPGLPERDLLAQFGPRLQRRGYGPGVVREACRRYLAADNRS